MSGLRRLCKLYGRMTIQGIEWVWDYADDKPVRKSEMTKDQWAKSERIKWQSVRQNILNKIK